MVKRRRRWRQQEEVAGELVAEAVQGDTEGGGEERDAELAVVDVAAVNIKAY